METNRINGAVNVHFLPTARHLIFDTGYASGDHVKSPDILAVWLAPVILRSRRYLTLVRGFRRSLYSDIPTMPCHKHNTR